MKVLSVGGHRVVILLQGIDTNEQYTVMEATLPAGSQVPRHLHHKEDETFLVLKGQITFYLDNTKLVLNKGQFIFAPRGISHYFRNSGVEDAILLETASPSGIEHFFEAVGISLPDRQTRPVPFTAQAKSKMQSVAPSFGIDIFPS